jgi:hypothetical protein
MFHSYVEGSGFEPGTYRTVQTGTREFMCRLCTAPRVYFFGSGYTRREALEAARCRAAIAEHVEATA